jgi:hypothetical protein
MCGRPLGCKRKESSLTGGSTRSCVRPVHAAHDRWPRWGPRSSPNTRAASKACAPSGFSGSSARPIVISCSSFTPTSTRVRTTLSRWLSVLPRVIATDADSAIPILNPDRNHVAVRSREARRDRDHISPAVLRRPRCLASSPAMLPARRHTRRAGPRAQRWCRASAGHGCDGRLGDGSGAPVRLLRARRARPHVRFRSGESGKGSKARAEPHRR